MKARSLDSIPTLWRCSRPACRTDNDTVYPMTPLTVTPATGGIARNEVLTVQQHHRSPCLFSSWTSSNFHRVEGSFFLLTLFFSTMLLIIPWWSFIWNVTEGIYLLISNQLYWCLTLFCTSTHIYSKTRADHTCSVQDYLWVSGTLITAHIKATLDSCFSKEWSYILKGENILKASTFNIIYESLCSVHANTAATLGFW